MNTNTDPISSGETGAIRTASKQDMPRLRTTDPDATKPPLIWMLLPLLLIGLAIYFAR